MTRFAIVLIAATALGAPDAALAHPGSWAEADLSSGLLHPWTGLDHVAGLVAIGALAYAGGTGGGALAATALLAMAGGALAGLVWPSPGAVDPAILVSLLALAVLLATRPSLSLPVGAGVIAIFAVLHGYAHGTGIPAGAHAVPYSLGFMASSAALLGTGAGLALVLRVRESRRAALGCGAAVGAFALAVVVAG